MPDTHEKIDLKGLCLPELEAFLGDLGAAEAYRARQIARWIFQKHVSRIQDMTNLSKPLRQQLDHTAYISSLRPEKTAVSCDGSKKFLFKTRDGYGIESVLIPEKNHSTLCISTQIGCALGCRFCCTGRAGLTRNLSAAEIVNQVSAVLSAEPSFTKPPNLVFMGMGEPLMNYDSTVKSIRMLTAPWGFNFSHRKITVSTAGIVPGLQRLGHDVPVNLAISLNAPDDGVRNFLMPVNQKYPLHDLLGAARCFPLASRKRITFEYILIRDINDSPEHARKLTGLLKNIACKINLIPFNPHPSVSFQPPEEHVISSFQEILHSRHFTAPIRRSKGADIAAACGQLGEKLRPSG